MSIEKLRRFLAEDAGNLSSMPRHVIKLATKRGGGRNSPVTDSKHATSHHAMKKALNGALKSSGTVAIRANGKHVATVHTVDGYSQRQEYGVTKHDGEQKTYKQTHYPRRSHYNSTKHGRKAYLRAKPRTTEGHKNYSKADAIMHAMNHAHSHTGTSAEDKKAYSAHKFTVHAIGRDENRAQKQAARREAQGKDRWGHKKADVGLEKIKDRAADRMASKYVQKSGAVKTAHEHHEKIGNMIKAGDHEGAIKHLDTLRSHLSQARRDRSDHENVKRDIRNMKTSSFARERLRKLSEDAELVTELSKQLLGRYIQKATREMDDESWKAGRHGALTPGSKEGSNARRKANNRRNGILRSATKVTGVTTRDAYK